MTHQLSQVNIGGDLNLTGTQVAIGTSGKGSGFIAAGGAVNIAAMTNEANSSLQTDPSSKSYDKQVFENETVVGSAISAAGNLKVDAGAGGAGSANIVASSLSAGEALRVSAAYDVNVVSAQERHLSDTASTRSSGGALRKKTTQQADYVESSQASSSSLSGKTIDISTGKDINVRGSAIAGEGNVDLSAGGSVNFAAATSTLTEKHHKEVKESGFLSGGGFGISFGERTTTTDQARDAATQSGQSRSMVGSIGGNLNISAGNAVKVSGSDLHAGRDMTLEGKSVTIDVGRDDVRDKFEQSTVQDGLTLAVGGSVVGALQTMQTMKDAASQSKDGRIQALAAATAALAAKNTANDIAQNGLNVSVSLTAGHSESHTSTTSQNLTNVGSTLKAGNDITIRATGAGADSNINIVGSDVNAGGNIKLKADNEVNLIAAQDTESQHTDSRSMSASAGVGASFGTKGPAIGFTASASIGKGKKDGKGTTQLNSHVAAGNQLTIESGDDTNIKGAVASGKQVVVDVGGDLNIESLQDTATFDSKNQSLGLSGTFGAGASVSGSFSDSKLKSDYASVQEQSGIRAGADGFQLVVKGNTDLKGAVISSSQDAIDAGKNSLATGTLTASDIENYADYKGHSVGLSGGIGSKSDSRDAAPDTSGVAGDSWKLMQTGGTGMNAPIAVGAKGSDSSTTQSGISGGLVTITNGQQQQELTGKSAEQVLADLNRDVSNEKDTSGRLENDFDKASIQAGFEIVGAFSGQVSTFLADKARDIDRARAEAEKADANADRLIAEANGLPEGEERSRKVAEADDYLAKAVSSRVDANSIEEQWGPGGTYRQIVSAVTAAAAGNVSGATNEFVQQSVVNWVQANAASGIKQLAEDYGIAEGTSTHAALHAISACAGANFVGAECGTAATAAASAALLNSLLLKRDEEVLNAEQKQARAGLIQTLVVGAAVMAGNSVEVENSAAQIELENNSNVKKAFSEAINSARSYVDKGGEKGLEKLSKLLESLEIKELQERKELIQRYIEESATRGGLSQSEIAAFAMLSTVNELVVPEGALDLVPIGKIKKIGILVKEGRHVDDAVKIVDAKVAEGLVENNKIVWGE